MDDAGSENKARNREIARQRREPNWFKQQGSFGLDWLKTAALTLDSAKAIGKPKGKRRMVFAPTKYLDQDFLDQFGLDFARLPYEIYQLAGGKKKAGD